MKKIKKIYNKIRNKIINSRYNKYLKSLDNFQATIHIIIVLIIMILSLLYPVQVSIVVGLISLIAFILMAISNAIALKLIQGNGIIAGGRGKGKGVLLNKIINKDKNKVHYCNVPYNKHTKVLNVKEYINSIHPNTILNFINDDIKTIQKDYKFEGINVYWDDISVYAPNHMDNELKKLYPSMSALLPINRHLYNAYMIITVQDINRPYKLLRELQTDFSVVVLKTHGFGYIWRAIPILNMLVYTKAIWYDNVKSAQEGILPFNAKAIVNETVKHGYLTSGQATKEQFNSMYGSIKYIRVFQRKSSLGYNTRYFHELLYGHTKYKESESVVKGL